MSLFRENGYWWIDAVSWLVNLVVYFWSGWYGFGVVMYLCTEYRIVNMSVQKTLSSNTKKCNLLYLERFRWDVSTVKGQNIYSVKLLLKCQSHLIVCRSLGLAAVRPPRRFAMALWRYRIQLDRNQVPLIQIVLHRKAYHSLLGFGISSAELLLPVQGHRLQLLPRGCRRRELCQRSVRKSAFAIEDCGVKRCHTIPLAVLLIKALRETPDAST